LKVVILLVLFKSFLITHELFKNIRKKSSKQNILNSQSTGVVLIQDAALHHVSLALEDKI